MNTTKESPPVLREVLVQFSVEQDAPDQHLLNSYIEKYPQFESQLRSLAPQLMDAGDKVPDWRAETGRLVSRDIDEAAISVSVFQSRFL